MFKVIAISLSIVIINIIAFVGHLINEKILVSWWGDTNISYPAILSIVLTNINILILIGIMWKQHNKQYKSSK